MMAGYPQQQGYPGMPQPGYGGMPQPVTGYGFRPAPPGFAVQPPAPGYGPPPVPGYGPPPPVPGYGPPPDADVYGLPPQPGYGQPPEADVYVPNAPPPAPGYAGYGAEPAEDDSGAGNLGGADAGKIAAALCCCCCCIAIFVIIIMIARAIVARKASEAFCNTTSCMSYATLLKASIDTSQDPCNNFYRFACNGWDRANNISVFRKHHSDFIRLVGEKAETLKTADKVQSAAEKAAKYYQTCVGLGLKNRTEHDEFKHMLSSANITWSSNQTEAAFLDVMSHVAADWDATPVLKFSKAVLSNGTVIVHIMPGHFIRNWEDVRASMIKSGVYFNYYAEAYQVMTGQKPTTEVFNKFKEMEDKIMAKLNAGLHDRTSTAQTDATFQTIVSTQYSKWRNLFSEVLGIPYAQPISFYLYSPAFFTVLRDLTLSEGESNMVLFLSWGVFYEVGRFFLPDMAAYADSSRDHAQEVRSRCLLHVENYMGIAISMPYIGESIPSVSHSDIRSIARLLDEVVMRYFKKKFNFDYFQYQKMKTSVDMFSSFGSIGKSSDLDQLYTKFPDMDKLFSTNLLHVVAAWRARSDKEKSIHATYLHNLRYYRLYDSFWKGTVIWPSAMAVPIYAPDVLLALRYGALGSLMLTAVMEDLYVNAVPQMQSRDRDTFTSTEQCLQKGRAGSPKLPDETVYQSAAGKVLWHAYRSTLYPKVKKGEKRTAKEELGLSNITYNANQLVFIASCYLRCSGSTHIYEEGCNAPMRNNKYFGHAFDCHDSKPMNPKGKCSVF